MLNILENFLQKEPGEAACAWPSPPVGLFLSLKDQLAFVIVMPPQRNQRYPEGVSVPVR